MATKRLTWTRWTAAVVACACVLTAWVGSTDDAAPEREYIGAGRCRMCHPDQFKSWEKTPHARAFSWLEVSADDAQTECLACHTTGYGKPTGYDPADEDSKFENVQCEACHGPGSLHMEQRGKGPIDRDPPATVCTDCHSNGGVHSVGEKEDE